MTAAAIRYEPEERENPLNGMLDLFEAQVSLLLEHGAEAQLRTRMERLLPPTQKPVPVPEKRRDADREIGLANVLAVLLAYSRRRDTEPVHFANARARAFIESELRASTGSA